MAVLDIYWNRNYYVEFLHKMKTYREKKDHQNILADNLHTMLISTEMISVTRLWSILQVAIVMPICYLSANVYKWKLINWGKSVILIQIQTMNSHHCNFLNDLKVPFL